MESKVKIFGHPMHPMLVAYPVAFNTGAFATYITYGATAEQFWLRMAIVLTIAAVASALVAALPGFVDWLIAIPARTEAKRTGMKHMLLNYASVALFGVTLIMYAGKWNATDASAAPAIVMTGIGITLTILAGFQGWKLVQDHHVGVKMTGERPIEQYRRAG